MKNHILVNGRLLQTNKKWTALHGRQKSWIMELVKEEHAAFVAKNGKLPTGARKAEMIDDIYARINERGIWMPYGEFKRHVGDAIGKTNQAHPLWNNGKCKATPKRIRTDEKG